MGTSAPKLPPIEGHDVQNVMSHGLETRHIQKLWLKFIEVDVNSNGSWSLAEVYNLLNEPRTTMKAPLIEALFLLADSRDEGGLCFQDFLVSFTSFCALSKEELLQLFFIIIDKNRNGTVDKSEMIEFFSTTIVTSINGAKTPLFPVNNKNALDKFRGGKWDSLEFDDFVLFCQSFPYIPYPLFHFQERFRRELLGRSFWEAADEERDRYAIDNRDRNRKVQLPDSGEIVHLNPQGRVTMAEILEYSERKTVSRGGKRVSKHSDYEKEFVSLVTRKRDEAISRCPLLTIIRNPHCQYHVPYQSSREVAAMHTDGGSSRLELALSPDGGIPTGVFGVTQVHHPDTMSEGSEEDSGEGSSVYSEEP